MSRILTVKQINNYISGVFDDELILHDISVSGEIFEFKVSGNNTFIVLKEDDNILECYKYGRLEQFERGAKVTVSGRIKYYPKSGKISLTVANIQHTGEGKYHADFLKLKEKLRAEGLFDNNKPLPAFVKRVAIITSSDGAVIHDFYSVISKLHGYIAVELYNVNVQGGQAKDEITAAIKAINNQKNDLVSNQGLPFDVIVIARGGGSYQDLLPFNSEEIARAVFQSGIPIISAVGHETDYTLCDFCSSLRAPTPSLAAEAIAKINQECFERTYSLLFQMHRLLENKLNQRQNYVSMLARDLSHKNELALQKIESKTKSQLVEISTRLERRQAKNLSIVRQNCLQLFSLVQRMHAMHESAFFTLSAKLDALNPLRLAAVGYAKVSDGKKLIKSVDGLSINQELSISFKDGTVTASIAEIHKNPTKN